MKSGRQVILVGSIAMGVVILCPACSKSRNQPGTSPISNDRAVEYLDLTPGEIPQWKKQGEITLPITNEQE